MPTPAANPMNVPSMTSPAMAGGLTDGAPSVAIQVRNPTTSSRPARFRYAPLDMGAMVEHGGN